VREIRRMQVLHSRRPCRTQAAESMRENDAEHEDADRVVPVEQLERPLLLARELLRVGPRSPAEHGEHAKRDRDGQSVHYEHGSSSAYQSARTIIRTCAAFYRCFLRSSPAQARTPNRRRAITKSIPVWETSS